MCVCDVCDVCDVPVMVPCGSPWGRVCSSLEESAVSCCTSSETWCSCLRWPECSCLDSLIQHGVRLPRQTNNRFSYFKTNQQLRVHCGQILQRQFGLRKPLATSLGTPAHWCFHRCCSQKGNNATWWNYTRVNIFLWSVAFANIFRILMMFLRHVCVGLQTTTLAFTVWIRKRETNVCWH